MSSVITGTPGSIDLSATVPDDGDPPDAADYNVCIETLLDNDAELDARLTSIETDDANDKYIIGNGTPPLAGYTPTTRPINIKGAQGVEVETFNVSAAGSAVIGGTLRQDKAHTKNGSTAITIERQDDIDPNATSETLSHAKDFYYVDSPSPAGNVANYTVSDPTSNGVVLEIAAWTLGINTVNIKRSDASTIVSFSGAPGWGSCRLRSVGGSWRLVGASGAYTTGTP